MRGLHEIIPIQDTLCSGIGAIERLEGDLFRFWLYVSQTADDTGAREKILVAKVVLPKSVIPDAILQAIIAIAGAEIGLVPITAEMLH